jgi:hypothetical protein
VNIPYRIEWPATIPFLTADLANPPTVMYKLSQLNTDGTLTQIATDISDAFYDTTIDNTVDYVWYAQTYDSSQGSVYGAPYEIYYSAIPTLGSVRNQIRIELNDTNSANYRWSDAELNIYLAEAIRDYSTHFPKREEITYHCQQSVRMYNLPPNFLEPYSAAYTDPHQIIAYLKQKAWKAGDSNLTTTGYYWPYWKLGIYTVMPGKRRYYVGHYSCHDGVIELDFNPRGDPNEYLSLAYAAYWTVPKFDPVPIDLPEMDHELIVLYAKAKALTRIESDDANLSRWTEGKKRDDNPLLPVSTRFWNAYQTKIEQRKTRPRFIRVTRV